MELPRTLEKCCRASRTSTRLSPATIRSTEDLEEFQRFNADLLAETQAAIKAGKSVDDAAASINLTSKYTGYERALKAAIQAIYDELKKK